MDALAILRQPDEYKCVVSKAMDTNSKSAFNLILFFILPIDIHVHSLEVIQTKAPQYENLECLDQELFRNPRLWQNH